MFSEKLAKALALLENVTPLSTDCGCLCGAACCRDNGEAGSGVWLLEGESGENMNWGHVAEEKMPVTGRAVRTLYCDGMCDRHLRPFMCRIFPLSPYFSRKKQAWDVRMDRRAAAVCPLFGYGKIGLSPEFTSACAEAVRILAEDPQGEELLEALQSEEAAYRMEL